MTTVSVYSYTHSVTYVTDNVLKSLKDVIRLSGMDPTHLTNEWASIQRAMKAWIESKHLTTVKLEIYDPKTNKLALRWDVDISYEWSGDEGSFYTDTDQLRYHIRKAGLAPQDARYVVLLHCKAGRPDVAGWGPTSARSTDGLVRQSLGSTINHSGLGASAAYWRAA